MAILSAVRQPPTVHKASEGHDGEEEPHVTAQAATKVLYKTLARFIQKET